MTAFGHFLTTLSDTRLFSLWPGLPIVLLFLGGLLSTGLLVLRDGRPVTRALGGAPLFTLAVGAVGFALYVLGLPVSFALGVFVVSAVAAIAAAIYWRSRDLRELMTTENSLPLGLFLALGLLAAVFGVAEAADGTVRAIPGAWGDVPYHTLIAEHFVRASPGSLAAPHFVGGTIHEPVALDFLAAVLRRGGLTVAGMFTVPAALFFASLFGSVTALVRRFAPSSRPWSVAAVAIFSLLTFNGLQWVLMAPEQGTWSVGEFFGVHAAPWDRVDEVRGIVMPSPLIIYSSQRHLLLAASFLAVLALALVSHRHASFRTRRDGHLAALAVGTALLPLFHAHGFIIAGALWLGVFLWHRRKEWFLLGVAILALALPIVLWQSQSFAQEGFLQLAPGWLAPRAQNGAVAWEPGQWVMFWLINAGLVLPLGILAVIRRRGFSGSLLGFAGLLAFVLGNIIQLQPHLWDNHKLFFLAEIVVLPLILGDLLSWARTSVSGVRLRMGVVGVLLFTMGLTSLAEVRTHAQMRMQHPVYAARAREEGAFLDKFLPTNAVVFAATDEVHNHPLTLTGRQLVSAYAGWIWTHGFDFARRSGEISAALSAPSRDEFCRVLTSLSVTHVVVGREEQGAWDDAASTLVANLIGLSDVHGAQPPTVFPLSALCPAAHAP